MYFKIFIYQPFNYYRWIFFIMLSVVSISLNAQCWEQLDFYGGKNSSWDIFFLTDKVGYAQGTYDSKYDYSELHKTTDGGKTWKLVPKNDGYNPGPIYYVDNKLGFSASGGTIARTEDGGKTWTAPVQNNKYQFRNVFFLNKMEGWAIAYPGEVLHTNDSGKSWQLISSNSPHFQYLDRSLIYFFNKSTGFTTGRPLAITKNGGRTWQPLEIGKKRFNAIDYQVLKDKVILITKSEQIVFNNKGEIIDHFEHIFHPYHSGIAGSFPGAPGNDIGTFRGSVGFFNEQIGWFTSQSGIYYTRNGGRDWDLIYSAHASDIHLGKNGEGFLYRVYDRGDYYNYIYSCTVENNENDYFDRCFFSRDITSEHNNTIRISNHISRDNFSIFNNKDIPTPSCWTGTFYQPNVLNKPYWIHFKGDGKPVSLQLKKSKIEGYQNLRVAVYEGNNCRNLKVVGCDQIDEFGSEIDIKLSTERNQYYYIVITSDKEKEFALDLRIDQNIITSNLTDISDNQISLFPNPTSGGEVKIKGIDNIPIKEIVALDPMGREVVRIDGNQAINSDKLAPGLYYIRIVDMKSKISYKKLIVQ